MENSSRLVQVTVADVVAVLAGLPSSLCRCRRRGRQRQHLVEFLLRSIGFLESSFLDQQILLEPFASRLQYAGEVGVRRL